jgi:hypothetical protein
MEAIGEEQSRGTNTPCEHAAHDAIQRRAVVTGDAKEAKT